jgi:hypothetical protein
MWAMAFGSRATAFVPIPFIIGATVLYVWLKRDHTLGGVVRNTLALGVPFACGAVAYGVYNYLRFDSPFEFGTRYQVTLQRFTTHGVYVIPNVYSYLFAPLKWSCSFPFVAGQKFRPLSTLLDWPPGYLTFEMVGGVLVMGGFLWLQFLHVGWGVRWLLRRLAVSPIPRYSSTSFIHRWVLICAVGFVLSLGPALGLWEASMRYAGDAVGGMVIASVVAAFWLVRRGDDSPYPAMKNLSRIAVLLLGFHSCFVGALTAFTSYDEPFKRYNPTLFHQLVESLSICQALQLGALDQHPAGS